MKTYKIVKDKFNENVKSWFLYNYTEVHIIKILFIVRESRKYFKNFKEEFRDTLIGQEYINKCKNGHRTRLFHSQGNKSIEASSERTEFKKKRICLQEIVVLLYDQI